MASPRLHRAAYRTQQTALLLHALAAQRFLRAMSRRRDEPPREVAELVQHRYRELLERDLANVEAGLYPRQLLFQMPVGDYARQLPSLARDIPRTYARMRRGNYQDIPDEVDLRRYPAYYRRNFHWQTDGYLSRRSAELYDVGVELLFLGTADVMRRQIIPPITRFLKQTGQAGGRLLDVACGTGRTLRQIGVTHPGLTLYGLDLSPYYLDVARDLTADTGKPSLLCENAESMPFRQEWFDVLTSVHLFHELPRNARHNVFREMYRVLRPGGLLVIEDSAQLSDSPTLEPVLDRFARDFHEPFYSDYIRNDLAGGLAEAGFEVESSDPQFVSKVVVARKPGGRRPEIG